tara:strand:- start:220 stop:1143 length:924 start_codon:yes stop_codon:yes gene_type:complete
MLSQREYTRHILKQVRQIEIRTNRLVTDAMAGAYHSVFKGMGMDFEEVREYSPGDEVRTIDWNVTARMGRPFIKKYREERELTLMLAVDVSASGDFGSGARSKRELAAEIASILAFAAAKNNDKVGLLLFTDQIELFIPPKKGRRHILRIIRDILFFTPERKKTDIPHALSYLNSLLKRKAVVFLISDFLRNDGEGENLDMLRALRTTHRRHDLNCITIHDPREHTLPNLGILTLEDAETGAQIDINTGSEKVRKAYAMANHTRSEALKKQLLQHGIEGFMASTDRPYIQDLRKFFERRSAGRRHHH